MGGVKIFFEDAHSGEILTNGLRAGSTSDTARIMKTVLAPGASLTTPETAAYTATLDIDRPRLVTIRAYGPLAQAQAATEVSLRQWVLPGFAVDVLSPANHLKLKGIPHKVRIQANVTMMCGCGLEPGGLWDPANYEIQSEIRRKGEAYRTLEMIFAGRASHFRGRR